MKIRQKKSIAKQHVTKKQSGTIMESYLEPPDWIIRPDEPDYHIDYNIELGVDENPDGQRFFVQLKGRKKIPKKSEFASASVKAEHLWYYANKCRLPVFILLADIENKKVYYIFIQQWIYDNQKFFDPDDTKKIQIKIPRSQSLDSIVDFRSSVKEALVYMNERYPGSPAASIELERKKLEILDPNFTYDLSFTNNGKTKHVTLLPKEGQNPNLTMKIGGHKGVSAIRQNFESGRPIKLTSEHLQILGSKLLERMDKFTLECKPTPAGVVDIRITGNEEATSFRPFTMTGDFYKGNSGFTINAKLKDLLELELVARFEADGKLSISCEKMSFLLSKWIGGKILTLPYFDQISIFTESLNKNQQINYEIDYNGLYLGKGQIAILDNDGSETTQSFTCRALKSIRTVCTRVNINPDCPDISALSDDELEWWFEAASLIENDSIKRSGEGLKLTGELADPSIDLPKTGLFKIESDYAYSAFCGEIFLGKTEMILEGCHAKKATCSQTGKHQFIVTGPPSSTLKTRLI
ncbi:DUF4365 domain-containing protein [Coraliomargarita sp. W4R53]